MNDLEDIGCGGLIVVSILSAFIGCGIGCSIEDACVRSPMRAKAVELGAARWELDQKTGKAEFKWKDEQ